MAECDDFTESRAPERVSRPVPGRINQWQDSCIGHERQSGMIRANIQKPGSYLHLAAWNQAPIGESNDANNTTND